MEHLKHLDLNISFQKYLYSREEEKDLIIHDDYAYVTHEIIQFSKIRPFELDFIIEFCLKYYSVINNGQEFKDYLLCQSIARCPKVTHLLFKKGFFSVETITNEIIKQNDKIAAHYFLEDLESIDISRFKDTNQAFSETNKNFHIENKEILNQMITYGFIMNSCEYVIKYDDDLALTKIMNHPTFISSSDLKWSCFEWTQRPVSMDIISFAAHFGSIKCFRLLMVKQCCFNNNNVVLSSIFSGSVDILHQCEIVEKNVQMYLNVASKSFRFFIFEWLLELNQQSYNLCFDNNSVTYALLDSQSNDVNIKNVFRKFSLIFLDSLW